MKTRYVMQYSLMLLAALAIIGCASTPTDKGKQATLFPQPIAKVQQAAIDALTVNGFDIKKQEPTYVEGFRPHKMGLLVGSGGETSSVWLEKIDDNKTSVKVATAKSALGMAGQKNWDAPILAEMTKILSK